MELLDHLVLAFETVKDPGYALKQQAYMRNQFLFLGLSKPTRAAIQKQLFKQYPIVNEEQLIAITYSLWEKQYREYKYVALDLLWHYRRLWTKSIFVVLEYCIRTESWWDTVDILASKLLGKYLIIENHNISLMDQWIIDENMWIRRSALLYQLTYKNKTDTSRLFSYCLAQGKDQDFFIRKAIGWVLRQYAKTNAHEVLSFITTHNHAFSSLTKREACKHLK